MTKSESKFKQQLEKIYPDAYIRKLPDFKQTGNTSARGLPDYVVFSQGRTLWFEVKYIKSLKTFNLDELNEYQWVALSHMLKAGVDVQVAIFNGNFDLSIIPFSVIEGYRRAEFKSLAL